MYFFGFGKKILTSNDDMSTCITIKSIGFVRNAFEQGCGAELRKGRSELVINPELTEALDNIDEYSHVVVVFWMDRVSDERRTKKKIKPPYAPQDLPPRGVLATRVPSRPNPIGVSTVPLSERRGNILIVDGLDAFNNTPILDIKPFTGHVLEDVREYRFPEWEKPKKA